MKLKSLGLLLLTFTLSACSSTTPKPNTDSNSATIIPPTDLLISPLAGLAMPHAGTARHEGSWDRSGGNSDARQVKPGKTITLLDYKGAGIIRRFWCTIAPRGNDKSVRIHRQAILRMYWDDEESPCVECPIGDFFGVGFGQQKDYISLPLNETSGGYNCYWPMPFHKHARWTITNNADVPIDAFYYNIDFTTFDPPYELPKEMKHFHAQWRRENPTNPKHNYTILEAEGDGHFVGTALFMQARKPRDIGFLEGDEVIYIDQGATAGLSDPKTGLGYGVSGVGPDSQHPTPNTQHPNPSAPGVETDLQHQPANTPNPKPTPQIIGTGTEDYFSSGWYFDRGLYSAPFHGVTIKDELLARVSAYRWHIEDAMPFHKNIRVSIEHGTNNERDADYSSVAYYYQSEPHRPGPPLPTDPASLLASMPTEPAHFKGVIEAESLRDTAHAAGGNVEIQQMGSFTGTWSGDAQLFWTNGAVGDTLNVNLSVEKAGKYALSAYFTTAPDYAIIQPLFKNEPIGKAIDLYSSSVASHSTPRLISSINLKRGDNLLQFKITGKNDRSTGTLVGIDAFSLKPDEVHKATKPAEPVQ